MVIKLKKRNARYRDLPFGQPYGVIGIEADELRILNDAGAAELFEGSLDKDLRGADRDSRLMRASLTRFLEETAPTNYRARQWGPLRRVRMSDNSHRWLCETCSNERKS